MTLTACSRGFSARLIWLFSFSRNVSGIMSLDLYPLTLTFSPWGKREKGSMLL
jgi:hypothetical protein